MPGGSLTIELRPMTPEFIEALLEGYRERASKALDVELPDGFPREGGMRFFALRLRQMRQDERYREWCPHVVVLDGQMIGHAGYHGPPGVNANQNPDAATELLDRAEERGVRHFIACTAPDNEPSLAIIRGLGFEQTGEAIDEEDGLELVFELER